MLKELKSKLIASLVALSMCMGAASVYAAEPPQDLYDEDAYTKYMETTIDELNALHAKANDKTIPQGEAEAARLAAFRKAREAVQFMDNRFNKMKIKEGATLSHTEVLMDIHVLTMLVDLIASEHLPHEDRWSYTY